MNGFNYTLLTCGILNKIQDFVKSRVKQTSLRYSRLNENVTIV